MICSSWKKTHFAWNRKRRKKNICRSPANARNEKKNYQRIIHDLKAELGNKYKEITEYKQESINKIGNHLKMSANVTRGLLEEKVGQCINLPVIIQKKTENNKLVVEMTKNGENEANELLDTEMLAVNKEHEAKMEHIKAQFENLSIKKRDDLERRAIAMERYLKIKK